MPDTQLSRDKHPGAFAWTSRILLLVSVLLPALLFALAAGQNRRDVMRETRARAERTAAVLHEHALKVFETQRLIIDRVNERLRIIDWDNAGTNAELHLMLKQIQESLDQVATITVTDAEGRMRASSRVFPADPTVSFADRDWFQALRERPLDQLYVSRSFTGRQSGQAVFNVADRAASPDGAFRGVVGVSVDRAYFEGFYRSVEPELDHNVTLVRRDGVILAREPPVSVAVLPPETLFLRELQLRDTGHYTATSPVDRIERVFSYRKVGPYPVYVGFGISSASALAGWWRTVAAYGGVALLTSLTLLGASTLVIRQTRHLQATRRDLAEANRGLVAEMRRREDTEGQLRQLQKMEAVGQLTGGIAHDFNNMLAVIIGSLNMIQRRLGRVQAGDLGETAKLPRLIDAAMEGATRAATLTQRLLAFSRQQPLAPEPVNANKLVSGMTELLHRTLGEGVRLETVLAAGLWRSHADPGELENALLNLAVNARDAMPEGGRLTIETANAGIDEAYARDNPGAAPGQYVLIAVTDTGSGMAPEVIARAFDPFFTTKPVGKGTGLGLSQVYGFVKQSGGHVKVYSEPGGGPGQGTTVRLYLPRFTGAEERSVAAPAPGGATAAGSLPAGSSREVVLVVEDEERVRQVSVEALRELGYTALQADGAAAALRQLDAHPEVMLLFTDIVMPDVNGRKLADEALRRRPDLKVLFTTGFTRNAVVHNGVLDAGVDLLTKPFTLEGLARKLREVLDAPAPR